MSTHFETCSTNHQFINHGPVFRQWKPKLDDFENMRRCGTAHTLGNLGFQARKGAGMRCLEVDSGQPIVAEGFGEPLHGNVVWFTAQMITASTGI
jgi:hypothetical protein